MQDLNERTAALETNAKNIFHQLDEIKEELRGIHHLTGVCEGISAKLTSTEEKLSSVHERMERLERAEGEDFRHYRRAAVTYLITGVLGALLGGVLLTLGSL